MRQISPCSGNGKSRCLVIRKGNGSIQQNHSFLLRFWVTLSFIARKVIRICVTYCKSCFNPNFVMGRCIFRNFYKIYMMAFVSCREIAVHYTRLHWQLWPRTGCMNATRLQLTLCALWGACSSDTRVIQQEIRWFTTPRSLPFFNSPYIVVKQTSLQCEHKLSR